MKKIDDNLKNNQEKDTIELKSSRRTFLKKATYSAPVLLALGQLAKPTKAQADSGVDGPPSGGGWGGFG